MRLFRPQLEQLESRTLNAVVGLPALTTAGDELPPQAAHTPPPFFALPLNASPTGNIATCQPAVKSSPLLRGQLDSIRQAYDVPALAGGVIAGGKLTEVATAGVLKRDSAAAVDLADKFHLGSNGKAMTATLAAILVERGQLRWNSTLAAIFPELRQTMTAEYRQITLEQLLNHRSGIGDPDDALFERIMEWQGSARRGRAAFLPEVLQTEPTNPAGEFLYSNTGYVVAAAMMERVAGQSYERLMRTLIFRPLGMTSAGFGPPALRQSGTQPWGHDAAGNLVDNGPLLNGPPILNPAGLVHMNMADWSKFLRLHLGEPVNGRRLLSPATLAKLHTPDPRQIDGQSYYGYGWFAIDTPLGQALWHNGSNGNWYSEALLIPAQRRAVFVVSNQGPDQGALAVRQALVSAGQLSDELVGLLP